VEVQLALALGARGLPWTLRHFDDTEAAWDAWDALTVCFAALAGWTKHDPMLLTTGIRDAYAHGLEVAIPTGNGELGWAPVESAQEEETHGD